MAKDLFDIDSIENLAKGFEAQQYITDPDLATVLFLMARLKRPLLLEGNAGVGKTEIANVLAQFLDTELIRLQCYEGLDVNAAVYEWNYRKQLLAIKIQEQSERSEGEKEAHIFGPDFLLERPLLKSIRAKDRSPVLLIDEVDRADEEFEAFLLELLSAFQISIPELGTMTAAHRPIVILTSNRTRELSDALKRRCLYHWIDYPSREKELKIVEARIPGINKKLASQVVDFIQHIRELELSKAPGVAESIDWAMALLAMDKTRVDTSTVERTLGCILKSTEDMMVVKEAGIGRLLKIEN